MQLGARPEHRPWDGACEGERLGRLRPSASQHARRRIACPCEQDAVVVPGDDRPVVHEERVGDAGEPPERVLIVDADRLVAHVPARHDERDPRGPHEEVMHRRRGKHRALPSVTRGDPGREGSPIVHQHDRGAPRSERRLRDRGWIEAPASLVHVADHDRERLVRPALPCAELADDAIVEPVARELEPAEPFHGDDRARPQQLRGVHDRIAFDRLSRPIHELEPRSARRTRDRLRVVAAVPGILVFAATVRTHLESSHRRVPSVVRQRGDDREARSAVRAVDEGVGEASIRRIEQLLEAAGAGRSVWGRQAGAGVGVDRWVDGEAGMATSRGRRRLDGLDECERRCLGSDRRRERVERIGGRLRVDRDPAAVVADPARDPEPDREAGHERSEPHPLHDPANLDAPSVERDGVVPHHMTSARTASMSAGSAARTASDRSEPAARAPASTPWKTIGGRSPTAAARPIDSTSPRPCDDREERSAAGDPSGPTSIRTRVPGARTPDGDRIASTTIARSASSRRSSRRSGSRAANDVHARGCAGADLLGDDQPGRVVPGIGVPAADHADHRSAPQTRSTSRRRKCVAQLMHGS